MPESPPSREPSLTHERLGLFEIESDRRYELPAPPEQVWDVIADVAAYRTWWPWLREFRASGLVEGDHWDCLIQPPLPYSLRLGITLEAVEVGRSVVATVSGDVRGRALLQLEPTGDGTSARVASRLAPENRLLRAMSLFARPIARYGHDWVFDTGVQQFRLRAL